MSRPRTDVTQAYRARVTQLRDLTHDVRVITLRLLEPRVIDFLAGQFVSFSVAAPGLPHGVTRPYSIVSSPRDRSTIELLLNLVPGGPGSTYLFSLREGDEVQFRGPAGTFVLRDDPDRHLLFVATATGIAPLRSMLLAQAPAPRPITLLWGLEAERDLYYTDELEALARAQPSFTCRITLSHPSAAWGGLRGEVPPLVDAFLASREHGVGDLAVYICGGGAMIRDVVARIRDRGTCPIYREPYYKG